MNGKGLIIFESYGTYYEGIVVYDERRTSFHYYVLVRSLFQVPRTKCEQVVNKTKLGSEMSLHSIEN